MISYCHQLGREKDNRLTLLVKGRKETAERIALATGGRIPLLLSKQLPKFLQSLSDLRLLGEILFLLRIVREVIQLFAVRPFTITPALIAQCIAQLLSPRHNTVGVFLLTLAIRVTKQWS